MAFYSPSEIKEILIKLSQEPPGAARFVDFVRLGVEMPNEADSREVDEQTVLDSERQRYACSVCKKKLESAHLLDLHVAENHDSYFELQKDRKPMVSVPEFDSFRQNR